MIQPAAGRLDEALLYLVTPIRPASRELDPFVCRVLEAGVDIIQLRDKGAEAGPLLRASEIVRRRTLEFGALFIVNDRVDVARAVGADGVHLGQGDLPVGEARSQFPAGLVGVSTHSREEVMRAEGDYLGVGPVHATPTKPGRPGVGLDLVRFAAAGAGAPFFAIGGITLENASEVIEAGATRICVLRALVDSPDPGRDAAAFKRLLERAPI